MANAPHRVYSFDVSWNEALGAGANDVGIESIEVSHEGLEVQNESSASD